MDKYVRGKVLGKGSFGVCSIVSRKADGKNFVVKEIDVSRMPKAERDTAELEAKVCEQSENKGGLFLSLTVDTLAEGTTLLNQGGTLK